MNLLVTGGAGSIGYHVIRYFLRLGWNITVIDSFRHRGYHERIQNIVDEFGEEKLHVIQHDLVCPISEKMKADIGDVDHIIHLAAVSDVFWGQENPVYTVKNNVESTIVMCEYAKTIPHKSFIYFSTDEVYGPVTPPDAHPEWDTHRPSNFYSASKAMSEDLCYAYWRNGDVNLIITNTMNNFGEWQSPAKFPVKVQRALEENKVVEIHGNDKELGSRFYIHSEDVADALNTIMEHGVHQHEAGELDDPLRYHIVGDTRLNNLELAQNIAGIMGKDLMFDIVDFHKDNPAHDIHYGLENNNLAKLGWKEPMGFTKAMKRTIESNE